MSRHPKGLMILFFLEMWERFSFYGMKAILVLFLVSEINGGFGWSNDQALLLLGIYSMMAYMTSIPGGILADRWLGQKRAVMLGGLLLCAGHGLMALPAVWTFYAALILIVSGVGLLKPNVSTMVGGLYHDDDPLREAGFTIFYMGINLGSLLATLIVSYVGERIGWHYGFSLAGIGMLLGQLVFFWGRKHLQGVGEHTRPAPGERNPPRSPFTREQKDRIMLILISFSVILVFWIAFEQAAGLLTLYTKQYTDRVVFGFEIPASMFQSFNAAFILIFGTAVAAYWRRRLRAGKKSSAIFKMGIGTVVMGLGYLFMVGASLERTNSGSSSMLWLVGVYLFHTIGELCLSPVALSFITKVAPKRVVATMMGLFWAVTGFGNFLAAQVGRMASDLGEMTIFVGLVIFCLLIGGPLALLSKRINALAHGSEEQVGIQAPREKVTPATA